MAAVTVQERLKKEISSLFADFRPGGLSKDELVKVRALMLDAVATGADEPCRDALNILEDVSRRSETVATDPPKGYDENGEIGRTLEILEAEQALALYRTKDIEVYSRWSKGAIWAGGTAVLSIPTTHFVMQLTWLQAGLTALLIFLPGLGNSFVVVRGENCCELVHLLKEVAEGNDSHSFGPTLDELVAYARRNSGIFGRMRENEARLSIEHCLHELVGKELVKMEKYEGRDRYHLI